MNSQVTTKSTIAKTDDGTIQITFTIPFATIKNNREKTASELAKNVEVPGFRKGMAPLDKAIEKIPENTLLEKTLSDILPELLAKAVEEHKIKPIVYPKFELVSAKEDEDWQIRAITCETPEVKLGDYKKHLSGASKAKAIWTPDKGKDEAKPKEKSPEEKEQEIIKTLLETVKVKIPRVLQDEEVNTRLSNLLSRLEKLGLSLESYLASVAKTAETLRNEYEKQANEGLSLDFILGKIADEEKVEVTENEVEAAISPLLSTNEGEKSQLDTPERRKYIEVILRRRKALDSLLKLY